MEATIDKSKDITEMANVDLLKAREETEQMMVEMVDMTK